MHSQPARNHNRCCEPRAAATVLSEFFEREQFLEDGLLAGEDCGTSEPEDAGVGV